MNNQLQSDQINYIDFFNILKKRKIFILLIILLTLGLVYGTHNNKTEKIEKNYNGTLSMQLGYVTYLPIIKTKIDINDDVIRKLFLKRVYIVPPSNIIAEVSEKYTSSGMKIVSNYNEEPMITFKYSLNNQSTMKENLRDVISIVLKTGTILNNVSPDSNIKVFFPKIIEEKYSEYIISKKQPSLKMKLLVGFVMGLILAVISAVFLNRLKENKES